MEEEYDDDDMDSDSEEETSELDPEMAEGKETTDNEIDVLEY